MNSSIITEDQLTHVDNIVYSPKTANLNARSLFTSIQVGQFDNFYKYKVVTFSGKAKRGTNRGTDTPVVDVTMTDSAVPITESEMALDYSWEELGQANQVGFSLLDYKAKAVARALAERENQIIFNGLDNSDDRLRIDGLTSDPARVGYQTAKDTKTFVNSTGSEVYNFLQSAVQKITHLPGYASAKPVLLLAQAEYDALDREYNEYQDKTILDRVSKWFSQVKIIPELESVYTGKTKNMGIIMLNDADIVGIPDAMRVTRLQPEYRNGVTTIKYVQRHGGLAVRYPSAVVQLDGIA